MSDKTTWRMRALGVAAGVGVTALVLAGCSTTPPESEEPTATDTAVTVAEVNEFTGTNSNSDNGNLDINGKVNYLTRAGFYTVSDTYEVVPDESFGTMEVVSEDPLQVKYTLNDGLEWSDGEPITTDDLIFGWAATSGVFDDATLDPESGEAVSGTKYFAYAGSTEGVKTSTITDVADDKLSLTLEYDEPFVDWNIVGLIDQPVHVVAEKAGVDQAELIDTILTSPRGDVAAPAPVNETLKAAADFWNSGFDMTSLPDDPYLHGLLHTYFPAALREKFPEHIDNHPLHREITTTVLVNDTVNTGGTTYLHRLREETGASLEEIVRAQTVARAIFRSGVVWDGVEALDNRVEAAVLTRIRLHSRRLVERGTRWLLNNRPQPLQLAETVEFFGDRVEQVWSQLPKLLRGADLEWYQKIYDELTGVGVPDELATRVAGFSSAFPTLDIVSVADRMGRDPMDVAEVYYDLADRLHITQLMDRIIELPRADRWQSMARASIREDLYAAHQALTADVLAVGNGTSTPEQRFKAWEEKNAPILSRARTTLDEIQGSDAFDLANLSVAMRTMRTLLRQHS